MPGVWLLQQEGRLDDGGKKVACFAIIPDPAKDRELCANSIHALVTDKFNAKTVSISCQLISRTSRQRLWGMNVKDSSYNLELCQLSYQQTKIKHFKEIAFNGKQKGGCFISSSL